MRTIGRDGAKLSSGFLLFSGDRLLLLQRAPHTGNGGTWGLPGGRSDPGEASYAAAHREAEEEMQTVPAHGLVGELAVQRGHRRYEIFACRARKRTRRTWTPVLNDEHVDHRWVTYEWCLAHQHDLHPTVRSLFGDREGRNWLKAMFETARPAALSGGRRHSDWAVTKGTQSTRVESNRSGKEV